MDTKNLDSIRVEEAFDEILQERFIKTQEISSILSLAFTSNKNAIIYGPAGFGKSQMLTYITNAVIPDKCKHTQNGCASGCIHEGGCKLNTLVDADGNPDKEHPDYCGVSDVFVQSFGEGMDEAQLWGGIDMEKLQDKENPRIEYAPQFSFLNYSFAIFEEIFDAPPTVLLSLKDTLTARELRNGYQRYPMKTRCVVALTNKEPNEISALGPSAHALIERFPLQYNLKWDSYDFQDFRDLFNKVYPGASNRGITEIKDTLAEVLASAHSNNQFISPRSAIHALEACIEWRDRGDDAFQALRFVPGFEGLIETMSQDLADARIRRKYIDQMADHEMAFDDYYEDTIASNNPIQCLRSIKKFKQMDADLENMAMPDDLYETRNKLRDKIQSAIAEMGDLASTLAETMEI